MSKTEVERKDELFGTAWEVQTFGECIKWLAELQIYVGEAKDCNVYNTEKACGTWYISKITQTLADIIVEKSEKLIKELM